MSRDQTGPRDFCEGIFARRSAEERSVIARVKRVHEFYVADSGLRGALQADPTSAAKEFAARGLKVELPVERLRPVWDPELLQALDTEPDRWPEVGAWRSWIRDLKHHRSLMAAHGGTAEANPRFDQWRQRQIVRTNSEIGGSSDAITHPIVAYELCRGCSVGCWFCGISAESFKGHLAYTPDTARLWRGVLSAMVARFGTATQTGFCYWATDPMDNPDYDRFITDHLSITGWLPQTTTAAPFKDLALTRRVLRLFERNRCVVNRFPIITPRMLKRVHEEFTPEELLGVELVIHTKQSLVAKTRAGRMRARKQRLRTEGRETLLSEHELDTGTIACVSGFLVNMPEGTVRLVSPCRPSDRWPQGYRVYAEAHFETAEEFADIIDRMVESCMPPFPDPKAALALRADLEYEGDEATFTVKNNVIRHQVGGFDFVPRLGALLARGTLPAGETTTTLMAEGADIFAVTAVLQDLFNLGLIEEPFETRTLGGTVADGPGAKQVTAGLEASA